MGDEAFIPLINADIEIKEEPVSDTEIHPPIQPFVRKKRTFKAYSVESVRSAMEAVRQGLSINKSSKMFGVPKSTLQAKVTGKIPLDKRSGPLPHLNQAFEEQLEKRCMLLLERGFLVRFSDMCSFIEDMVKVKKMHNPFKKGRPSKNWQFRFFFRHPNLEPLLTKQPVTMEKRHATWCESLKQFISKYQYENLFSQSDRIYKVSVFNLRTEEISNNKQMVCFGMVPFTGEDADGITVVVTSSASGDIACSTVVKRNGNDVTVAVHASTPGRMTILRGTSGCDRGETFLFHLKEFKKYLERRKILNGDDNAQKVVLFVDGKAHQYTHKVMMFGERAGIILYSMYRHNSPVVPVNLKFIKCLQVCWNRVLEQHRLQNKDCELTDEEVMMMIMLAVGNIDPTTVRNSFKHTGLFPLEYSKLIQHIKITNLNELPPHTEEQSEEPSGEYTLTESESTFAQPEYIMSEEQRAATDLSDMMVTEENQQLESSESPVISKAQSEYSNFKTLLSLNEIRVFKEWRSKGLTNPDVVSKLYENWMTLYNACHSETEENLHISKF